MDIDVLSHRYSKEKHTGNPVDDYSFSLLNEEKRRRRREKRQVSMNKSVDKRVEVSLLFISISFIFSIE